MDEVTQARHNFVLAFQYCWNGKEFPSFREISVSEQKIHTGYCAIDLLDEALNLHRDFQEARDLRSEIWHAILTKNPFKSKAWSENYGKYLKSKAWSKIRKELFEQVGRRCICGDPATEVHHKTYDNIGKENLLTDLAGLCTSCHENVHQNDVKGEVYWNNFKAYVEKKGNKLQLFPEPHLPSIYGIQIDGETLENADIRRANAFWLIAYRSATELEANLCMQLPEHYEHLKEQKDRIKREFEGNLGEKLKWQDDRKQIGFFHNTVGHLSTANIEEEFSWLHDSLLRLYRVFHPRVSEFQISE